MWRAASVAMAMSASIALAAPGQTRVDSSRAVREVREASRLLDDALQRGDTAALARIYADGYVHIDQFGVRSGKAQRLAELGSGTRRVQAIGPVGDQEFAIFGDVVVASARTDGRQTLNGTPVANGTRMSTRVWAHRDGRWQVILAQVTPVVTK